jgi:hypothetical protein
MDESRKFCRLLQDGGYLFTELCIFDWELSLD